MPGQPARRSRPFVLSTAQTSQEDMDTWLTMDTLIQTVVDVQAVGGIPEEWQAILRWCAGPGLAVAEIAARLQLRLTPTTAVLNELRAHGLITHQAPIPQDLAADIAFLRKVRNGLENQL